MRGSPLLRAILAFLVIASMGLPLWRLTHATASQNAAPVAPEIPATEIRLQLAFTNPPSSVKVLHLGREIWHEPTPTAELEHQLALPYPKEGIDLEFHITWSNDALAAARVTLTDPSGELHERSLWGRGEVSEVLTFP